MKSPVYMKSDSAEQTAADSERAADMDGCPFKLTANDFSLDKKCIIVYNYTR